MEVLTRQVLVGTDFAPASMAAVEAGAALARASGGIVLLVHVYAPPMAVPIGYGPGGPLPAATPGPAIDEELVLATLSRIAADRLGGIDFDLRAVQHGSPSAALCSLAEAEEVDLIVVGTAGRRGIRRLLLGSVAEAVVRHAPCSVLVARPVEHQRRREET